MKSDQTYKTEIIEVIMPSQASSSHIFDSEKYEIINTYDENKNKLVILKEKNDTI